MKKTLGLILSLIIGSASWAFSLPVPSAQMNVDKNTALIMVDVQYDFIPGGTLAVNKGDDVVPALQSYMYQVARVGGSLFASQDWHPKGHSSFQSSGKGGIWPDHCVQNTRGAQIHDDLVASMAQIEKSMNVKTEIVHKGYQMEIDAYSAFLGTDLNDRLKAKGVRKVLVGGLATDYCVKATALDAVKNGYEVYFLADASRGVEVNAGDIAKAIVDMKAAGVKVITGDQKVLFFP